MRESVCTFLYYLYTVKRLHCLAESLQRDLPVLFVLLYILYVCIGGIRHRILFDSETQTKLRGVCSCIIVKL